MTLEQLIAENTAALKELARVMSIGPHLAAPAGALAEPIENPDVDDAHFPQSIAPVPAPAPSPAVPPPAPAAMPRRPGRPRKTPAAAAPEAPLEPAPAPATPATPAAAAPAPAPAAANDGSAYMDASRALSALLAARGRDVALGILQSFGASNLKQVPADQWPAVREAAQKALVAA